jgi:PBP1b-binding outer membrane lipoprotein LpoB
VAAQVQHQFGQYGTGSQAATALRSDRLSGLQQRQGALRADHFHASSTSFALANRMDKAKLINGEKSI